MWGFVKEWKWKGPFSHGNHSCGVWLLLLAAQSVSCGLRKAPSSFSDTEMSQDICSNWHPIGIPTERATEQPREASPFQSSLIYNVSLCMKKFWSLWSTVLGWHSFKMQLFWFQALSILWIWTEIQSMLWHCTAYAMPNKPLQNKHQDKLVFFPPCSAFTLWYFSDDIITLQKNVWHCRHG